MIAMSADGKLGQRVDVHAAHHGPRTESVTQPEQLQLLRDAGLLTYPLHPQRQAAPVVAEDSRRWCSMALCGNRAKAAAHRARATRRRAWPL